MRRLLRPRCHRARISRSSCSRWPSVSFVLPIPPLSCSTNHMWIARGSGSFSLIFQELHSSFEQHNTEDNPMRIMTFVAVVALLFLSHRLLAGEDPAKDPTRINVHVLGPEKLGSLP